MCCVLVFCLFFSCVLCVQCFQFLWIVNSWLPVWLSIMFFTISYTNCNKPVEFFFHYQLKKSCVLWIKIRKHSHYAIRNRSYIFTTNRTAPLPHINIVKPVKLQRSPLKPPIQPYVQFPSMSHILCWYMCHNKIHNCHHMWCELFTSTTKFPSNDQRMMSRGYRSVFSRGITDDE